jgi:hypothetical protein
MVNTFIPYADFKKCAAVLDNKRLGKQRVEAKQILNILTGETKTKGWRNHPVVLMWTGHTAALKLYYNIIVTEWIKRGFVNNMQLYKITQPVKLPWFIGNKSIHLSHQANLLRKDYKFYSRFFKKVPMIYTEYTYIWPGKLTEIQKQYLIKNKNNSVDIRRVSTITKFPSTIPQSVTKSII